MATTAPRRQAGPIDATDARTRPRQIGRGDRARERVLTAALDQLADEGSAGFTMQSIARRAGASKATLYRHWPSTSALLVDAMAEAFQPFPAPATGDLRGDLVALLTGAAHLLTSERFPRLMAAVVDLAERDPTSRDYTPTSPRSAAARSSTCSAAASSAARSRRTPTSSSWSTCSPPRSSTAG